MMCPRVHSWLQVELAPDSVQPQGCAPNQSSTHSPGLFGPWCMQEDVRVKRKVCTAQCRSTLAPLGIDDPHLCCIVLITVYSLHVVVSDLQSTHMSHLIISTDLPMNHDKYYFLHEDTLVKGV